MAMIIRTRFPGRFARDGLLESRGAAVERPPARRQDQGRLAIPLRADKVKEM